MMASSSIVRTVDLGCFAARAGTFAVKIHSKVVDVAPFPIARTSPFERKTRYSRRQCNEINLNLPSIAPLARWNLTSMGRKGSVIVKWRSKAN